MDIWGGEGMGKARQNVAKKGLKFTAPFVYSRFNLLG